MSWGATSMTRRPCTRKGPQAFAKPKLGLNECKKHYAASSLLLLLGVILAFPLLRLGHHNSAVRCTLTRHLRQPSGLCSTETQSHWFLHGSFTGSGFFPVREMHWWRRECGDHLCKPPVVSRKGFPSVLPGYIYLHSAELVERWRKHRVSTSLAFS